MFNPFGVFNAQMQQQEEWRKFNQDAMTATEANARFEAFSAKQAREMGAKVIEHDPSEFDRASF